MDTPTGPFDLSSQRLGALPPINHFADEGRAYPARRPCPTDRRCRAGPGHRDPAGRGQPADRPGAAARVEPVGRAVAPDPLGIPATTCTSRRPTT
jgi:hypothetical protein